MDDDVPLASPRGKVLRIHLTQPRNMSDFQGDMVKKLQLMLQSWFNQHLHRTECKVLSVLPNMTAEVEVINIPDVKDLQKLNGAELTRNERSITVEFMELLDDLDFEPRLQRLAAPPPDLDQQMDQHDRKIESRYDVKVSSKSKASFQEVRSGGNPKQALNEIMELLQANQVYKHIPLQDVDPQAWGKMLEAIQGNKDRLLLTISVSGVTIHGEQTGANAIFELLKINRESAAATLAAPPMFSMMTDDPLCDTGLCMEEWRWQLLMSQYHDAVMAIGQKYDVGFDKLVVGAGKVAIKPLGKDVLLKSHAIRALLALHQKIATAPPCDRGGHPAGATSAAAAAVAAASQSDCPICLEQIKDNNRLKCGHEFCASCLSKSVEAIGSVCPVCKDIFGKITGNQPEGTMSYNVVDYQLPGFHHCKTIVIIYRIHRGRQTSQHPNPGKPHASTHRIAYLPDNKEGREVLKLLKTAFDRKLIFTIGQSRTNGMEDQVTWNDIHHKTSLDGGPQRYGYPDPDYLKRVRAELKAKGIE